MLYKTFRKKMTVALGDHLEVAGKMNINATNGGYLYIDGSLLSGTELGYLDGVTAGTATASKALVLGSSKEIATITTATITTLTSTTVNGTTFDTNVAAAGVTLTATTLAADGTDTNINIAITPKGTGEVDITKVDIDAGAIDGTIIGANSAAAITGTTITASTALNIGSDAAGVDATFYGAVASYKTWWDANGDTNGCWYFGADTKGVMTYWYGDTTAYYTKFDPSGDTNGAWYFGADTKGLMVNLYGDTTGCGVFWNPSTDTNGTLTIGGSGGSKGNDVMIYGATSGSSAQWDQSANKLILTNSRLDFSNTTQAIEVACSAIGATGRLAKFAGTITNGALTDGYGALEVELTMAGTSTDCVAASSTWINMAASSSAGSNMVCAQNNGIWVASTGTPMASATAIIGMRMQYIAEGGENPGALYLFSTNIFSNALTAMFHVNAAVDIAWGAGAYAGGTAGHFPIFRDVSAGVTHYVNTYTAES